MEGWFGILPLIIFAKIAISNGLLTIGVPVKQTTLVFFADTNLL